MYVPFEYIKIDLRDFKSIKELRRSLSDMGADNEIAKYLFHIKDDKEIKIIFVDKVNFLPFAYYDLNSNIQLFQNLIDEMKNTKSLRFVPKSEANSLKKNRDMSVDLILDKISSSGIKSLSKVEVEYLKENSK